MNSTLTMPVVVGAVLGLGIYALVRAMMPSKRSAVSQVARIDAMRARGAAYESSHRTTADKGRLGSVRPSPEGARSRDTASCGACHRPQVRPPAVPVRQEQPSVIAR